MDLPMPTRVKLQEGISHYLDYTGHFKKLLKKLQDYEIMLKTEDVSLLPPLHFCIQVDYLLLADISGLVADILMKEPYVAEELFKKVVHLAVKSVEVNKDIKIGQAQIQIQITLPVIPDIMPCSKNNVPRRTGLFVIKGVIVACTVVMKYCRSTVYRCPVEGCVGQNGQRVFGDQSTASTGTCSFCGCVREEHLRARENGDQVLAVFVNPAAFQPEIIRHQGITVSFKDDLIKDLTLGICYNVVVSQRFSQYIAWGVERTTTEAQWRFDNNLPTVGIPQSITILQKQAQEVCPNSPWALSATLSSQIASHLYPVSSFLQLKTGLLLSLASQSEDHPPAPLLAVGPDCSALLYYASQLSLRCVSVTSPALCSSLGATVGETWLEAGPLLLASSGVCHLGDWAKFGNARSSLASQITAALESCRVDLVSSTNPFVSSPPSLPLRTAIWTFWSGDKATSTAQTQLRTLIEVFGMPFIGDGGRDIEAVADHLLYQSMQVKENRSDDVVPVQDLKKYLNIACSYKVQLTSEASKLLRSYFVASRRERPDCLPLKAIKTMTALAEAHARLCLRTQVTCDDVVLVVYLYEEAITALFGPSLMSPPPSLFGAANSDMKNLTIAEQVGARKKQSRSATKEEVRHQVLYRHQDCIPNPKLLQNCERHGLIGLKGNQSHDGHCKVVIGQEANDTKNNSKKLNSSRNKHDDKSDKLVQEAKASSQPPNGTLGNSEELSKSRKRRLRKRRLLVALAPTLTNSKPSPPPPVGNNQTTKPISRPVAQSSPAVPPNSAVTPSRISEPGKPSVKESRKRPEKSINSRSKSLKSKSLAETTHHSKADIIKTLEEKTLSSLLQTLVPLTNSSPKKEKPSLPLFSFPEKKFSPSESKVDKDGVFYFGETKHQLEKLSSSFSNYSTSPFSDKSETAQNKELNRNCFSASKISSLENIVPSFNFSQTISDRSNCTPAVRQNLFGTETVPLSNRVESNNIFSFPSNYQSKDFIFNSPVLKDLNQFRTELRHFGSPSLTTGASSTSFINRPNNIPENAAVPVKSAVGFPKTLNSIPVNITELKTSTDPPKLVQIPQNSCVAEIRVEKEPKEREISTKEIVNSPPVIMKSSGEINKTSKSREEVLLEREAKKAAKLAAKAKKSQNIKESDPNTSTTKTESITQNKNDKVENKGSPSISVVSNHVNVPESKVEVKDDKNSKDKPVASEKDGENDLKKEQSLNDDSSKDVSAKSKAQLKAERRAKQEAQRAAKAASKSSQPQPKEKAPQVKTEQPKPVTSIVSSVGKTEKKIEVAKTSTQPKPKLFSHLYREKTSLSSDKLLKVSGLHPAVVRLGVQYATRVVVGSNARCVALLRALKQLVNDYTTPSEKDFSRGLEEELGPVTRYLDQCRPLAVSMTNALRHLSRTLTQLPNSMTDAEAKRKICDVLETYIHEQINMAGKQICETVKKKIVNGDVILIYGCSSLLYQILLESHMSGVKFRVVVVDGFPWLEGREMLRRLVEKGLSCTYVLITAASFIMREATKVLLGAHALLANGYVMSRAGSSQVALLAHCCNVPVLVCCENHKFCERAQTDAFVYNELGELHCAKIKDKGRTLTNLTPLSLAYDITPPDLVTAVVTELAVLPCTSVPVILRIRPSELAM